MDLGAYAKIDRLSEIAKENNIDTPRLRGYRIMHEEEPIYIGKDDIDNISNRIVDDFVHSRPWWNRYAYVYAYDNWRNYAYDYYCPKDKDGSRHVAWNRIHGWKRKTLKLEIKQEKKRFQKQYNIWNKYAGKKNILYVHCRCGGGNFPAYRDQIVNNPRFIECVNDAFDSTYLDVYYKID